LLRLSLSHSILVLCLLLATVNASAQAPEKAKPSDVRIVIDISGSMKKNDPQNLRRPALDMLVKLLPPGSKAGVWTFGQYVNMLVKHRAVDSDWKADAAAKSSEVNSIAQFTNIGEALEKAAYDKASSKNDFQTHVILLTDGMVDIDRDPKVNLRERTRILNEILPAYQKAGYHIHTISLSDNADTHLMERLALETGGKSAVANNADELMKVFLNVFDQAVPKEELPLEGNSFVTDSSIEEFTALIFRQPGSPDTRLIAPDQSEYTQATRDSSVNWYRTDKYDLITIKQPLEGEWRISAKLEPQSRITVVSDLSLVVKPIATNLLTNANPALSLALREENKVVNRAEFLDLLDIDVVVKQMDTGKQWQQRLSDGLVPGNGVYNTQLDNFQQTGQYDVIVTVDGKSFQRRFTQSVSVRDPFAVSVKTADKDGKTRFTITVTAQSNDIDLAKTDVVGKLKDPSGASVIKNFTLTDQQWWELQVTPEAEGNYYLTLRITSTNAQGKVTNIIPEPLSFSYPQSDSLFEDLLQKEEPAPVTPVPPANEKKQELSEEPVIESPEEPLEEPLLDEGTKTKLILYGVLALVNILIVVTIYFLYRKLFGRAPVADDDEGDDAESEVHGLDAMAGFEEPPMDEIVAEDLTEDDIDLAEEDSVDKTLDDPFADLSPEALDDDNVDEDPEFSLDDFAPDALDDDTKKT